VVVLALGSVDRQQLSTLFRCHAASLPTRAERCRTRLALRWADPSSKALAGFGGTDGCRERERKVVGKVHCGHFERCFVNSPPFRRSSLEWCVLEENILKQACAGEWWLTPCASPRAQAQEDGMLLPGRRPSGETSVGRSNRRAGQAEPESQGQALRQRHTLRVLHLARRFEGDGYLSPVRLLPCSAVRSAGSTGSVGWCTRRTALNELWGVCLNAHSPRDRRQSTCRGGGMPSCIDQHLPPFLIQRGRYLVKAWDRIPGLVRRVRRRKPEAVHPRIWAGQCPVHRWMPSLESRHGGQIGAVVRRPTIERLV
jgi:hypothetical protein